MARDYEMISYIRNQMKGFDDRFINAVVKLFGRMVDAREPNGCLSNSAMLLACAKYCGYDAKLCYGLCNTGKYEIYHAWLEIDDSIFDIGIYGNSHFSPLYLEKYFDNSERHILWQFVCTLLDLSPTRENGDKIRKAIEGIVTEPDC